MPHLLGVEVHFGVFEHVIIGAHEILALVGAAAGGAGDRVLDGRQTEELRQSAWP